MVGGVGGGSWGKGNYIEPIEYCKHSTYIRRDNCKCACCGLGICDICAPKGYEKPAIPNYIKPPLPRGGDAAKPPLPRGGDAAKPIEPKRNNCDCDGPDMLERDSLEKQYYKNKVRNLLESAEKNVKDSIYYFAYDREFHAFNEMRFAIDNLMDAMKELYYERGEENKILDYNLNLRSKEIEERNQAEHE